MRTNIYLHFKGNCVEAFDFYKSVFGGEFSTVMKYEGSEEIMHISLPLGANMSLMGCDVNKEFHKEEHQVGNNISINICPNSKAESDKIFAALNDKTSMPMQDTFWGSYHGSCIDKFGIHWMIDCGLDKDEEVQLAVSVLKREVESLEKIVSNKKQKTT